MALLFKAIDEQLFYISYFIALKTNKKMNILKGKDKKLRWGVI